AALSPFDPQFNTSFTAQRSTSPASDNLAGANIASTLTHNGQATFSKTFDTGADLQARFNSGRTSSNSTRTFFNPSLRETASLNLSQPLLRGRGRGIQRIPYYIAQIQLDRSEEQARQQIIQLIAQSENVYWTAIQQKENLAVQQNRLNLAQTQLERNRRELELGAI